MRGRVREALAGGPPGVYGLLGSGGYGLCIREAGIVSERGPWDSTAFDQVVGEASSQVREIALAVRRLVYEVLPETVEVVWPRQGSVGWGTGPKKFSEQFAYLMPLQKTRDARLLSRRRVGGPTGLLRSGGAQVGGRLSMRSLKLTSTTYGDRSYAH